MPAAGRPPRAVSGEVRHPRPAPGRVPGRREPRRDPEKGQVRRVVLPAGERPPRFRRAAVRRV